ncbi:MAG: hypothetical protein WDA18_04260 [Candidatus Ratteibacteria bacterium]
MQRFWRIEISFQGSRCEKIDYSSFDCKKANWLSERTISFFTYLVYTLDHIRIYVDTFRKAAEGLMR